MINQDMHCLVQFGKVYDSAEDKIYRSPEALRGQYSDKSDIFSIGVILSQLLTLKKDIQNQKP